MNVTCNERPRRQQPQVTGRSQGPPRRLGFGSPSLAQGRVCPWTPGTGGGQQCRGVLLRYLPGALVRSRLMLLASVRHLSLMGAGLCDGGSSRARGGVRVQLSQEAEPPAGEGEDSRKRSLRGGGVCSWGRGEEVRERPCPSEVQLAQTHHLLSAKASCWCPQAESDTRPV